MEYPPTLRPLPCSDTREIGNRHPRSGSRHPGACAESKTTGCSALPAVFAYPDGAASRDPAAALDRRHDPRLQELQSLEQKRLCDLLHILALQRWRSGLRAEYTVDVLLKICAALNCDFADITNVDRSKNKSKEEEAAIVNGRNDSIQPTVTGELNTSIYQGIRNTLAEARSKAYSAVNSAMVEAYWEIGRQIDEAVGERAEYGKGLLRYLAGQLTSEFGKGFDESSLRRMRQFFKTFPIRATLWHELSWSHYRLLMKIEDQSRREFYGRECAEAAWSVRQLERQINSFLYERLLATQKSGAESVKNEIHTLEPKNDPDYILKDPYILEFLDLKENRDYHENDLEQALINKLQEFLLELGKGFSFVARQKRITIEGDHYYVDLVFYNYILKCFVVIDLKAGKLTYQDVGQMDFYVRYFEDKVKLPGDNPTIGIILCTDKNDTMAKYSVLSDNENLFASKYMLYLPTEEELKHELKRERELIERQKAMDEGADK